MEVVNQITYVCAILGGILLLLCVVLAAFFVYAQVKKHCCGGRRNRRPSSSVFHLSSNAAGRYTVVPTDNPEVEAANINNGTIVLKSNDEFDVVGGDEELGRRLIPGEPGDDRVVRIVQAAGTNSRKPQVRKYYRAIGCVNSPSPRGRRRDRST